MQSVFLALPAFSKPFLVLPSEAVQQAIREEQKSFKVWQKTGRDDPHKNGYKLKKNKQGER
jgi:glycyl-tRNA synthetase beta subunit